MMFRPWILLFAISSRFVAAATEKGASVGAVQKVISLLQEMAAKAKAEKNEEQVEFAKFSTWCKEETASVKKAIDKSAAEIESLSAEIGKLQSDVTGLGESISNLEADVATFETDVKNATEQRRKDRAAFEVESQDYSESVDAIDRALNVLEKQSYDRPGAAAALVQLSERPSMPQKARSIIAAFSELGLNDESDLSSEDAPVANAYEFQSSGVVGMLEKLNDEFREKLGECQKAEQNGQHAYNMMMEDLKSSIASAKKEIEEKTAEKGRKEEKIALNEKQLKATEVLKAEDEKTLSEMSAECQEKKLSFEEKQQLRADEIEAIEKAAEIMQSPDVSSNAEKYMSLSQGSAFAQVSRSGARATISTSLRGVRRRVRAFLQAESTRLHSRNIALLVEKLEADPFAKVKSLIDGMLTRLLEEAHEDADHEGFCDTEMGKSKVTRTKLSSDIDSLSAAVEEGKGSIIEMTQQIEKLSAELVELEKAVGEAIEMRQAEKATNAATIKDAKAAQAAVQAATAVLKEFYSKALTATSLLQRPTMGSDEWVALANPFFNGTIDEGHKEGMQTFGETYKGNQDGAGGVLALLEVISSDFSAIEADTTAAEEQSSKAHEQFLTESKKTKAMKTRQVDMNTADRTKTEEKVQQDTQDLKATQDELLAADRYYKKLVPQCVDQGMTFEERTAAREAEIKSLQEALSILSNEDIATSA